MSDDNDFFAAPPFKADEALMRLKKELRDLGLVERAGIFERRGSAIARAVLDGTTLKAAVVKRPSRSSPEWQLKVIKSSADARDFAADIKRKLAAWGDSDD